MQPRPVQAKNFLEHIEDRQGPGDELEMNDQETKWYLMVDETRVGPLTHREVCERFESGEVDEYAYVWRKGLARWESLCDSQEFQALMQEQAQAGQEEQGGTAPGKRQSTLPLPYLQGEAEEASGHEEPASSAGLDRAPRRDLYEELDEEEMAETTEWTGADVASVLVSATSRLGLPGPKHPHEPRGASSVRPARKVQPSPSSQEPDKLDQDLAELFGGQPAPNPSPADARVFRTVKRPSRRHPRFSPAFQPTEPVLPLEAPSAPDPHPQATASEPEAGAPAPPAAALPARPEGVLPARPEDALPARPEGALQAPLPGTPPHALASAPVQEVPAAVPTGMLFDIEPAAVGLEGTGQAPASLSAFEEPRAEQRPIVGLPTGPQPMSLADLIRLSGTEEGAQEPGHPEPVAAPVLDAEPASGPGPADAGEAAPVEVGTPAGVDASAGEPSEPVVPERQLTGARADDSVLFSFRDLQKLASRSLPGGSTCDEEGSSASIIDIRPLADTARTMQDEDVIPSFYGPPAAPILLPSTENGERSKGLYLGIGLGAAVILLAVAAILLFVLLSGSRMVRPKTGQTGAGSKGGVGGRDRQGDGDGPAGQAGRRLSAPGPARGAGRGDRSRSGAVKGPAAGSTARREKAGAQRKARRAGRSRPARETATITVIDPNDPHHTARPGPAPVTSSQPGPGGTSAPGRSTGPAPRREASSELDQLIEAATRKETLPTAPPGRSAPPPPRPGTELPETLSREQVASGMRGVNLAVRSCASMTARTGAVMIQVTIDGRSGRISGGQVVGTFSGTPAGQCVLSAAQRSARFPRFSGPPITLKYPFFLN